jgi:hypothetical protein
MVVKGAGGVTSTVRPMDVGFSIDASGDFTLLAMIFFLLRYCSFHLSFLCYSHLQVAWGTMATKWMRQKAKAFVDLMSTNPDNMAGLVAWDYNVRLSVTLTTNHASIKDAIDNLYADDGTNLNTSLTQAILVHDAITRPVDEPSSKAILFLTDGDPDFYGDYTPCGSPGSPASTAASMGLTIYAIGLGSDAVEAPLIDMATCTCTEGASYLGVDPTKLQEIFNTIYEEIALSTGKYFHDKHLHFHNS